MSRRLPVRLPAVSLGLDAEAVGADSENYCFATAVGQRKLPPMSDVTRLLEAIRHGDARDGEELLPLVYAKLRQHARAKRPSALARTQTASTRRLSADSPRVS